MRSSNLALLASAALLVGAAPSAFAGPPPASLAEAKGELKKALGEGDAKGVKSALEKLRAVGGPKAVKAALDPIPKARGQKDAVYWTLVRGATNFQSEAELRAVGKWIAKKAKPGPARDAIQALEWSTDTEKAYALEPVLTKGPYDQQLLAVAVLAGARNLTSADVLVGVVEREAGSKGDPLLRARALAILRAWMPAGPEDVAKWAAWWKENRAKSLEPAAAEEEDDDDFSADEDDEDEVAETGARTFLDNVLDPDQRAGLNDLQGQDEGRIVVITSARPEGKPGKKGWDWDKNQRLLENLRIPHVLVTRDEFDDDPQKYLKWARTVLVNAANIQIVCLCDKCMELIREARKRGGGATGKGGLAGCPPACAKHIRYSCKLQPNSVQALKRFVEGGGCLYTEHYGALDLLSKAWPKLVGIVRDKTREPRLVSDQVYALAPARGQASHPMLRGVFSRRVAGEPKPGSEPWQRSLVTKRHGPVPTVLDPKRVRVLMSGQVLEKHVKGGVAALTFRIGKKKGKAKGVEGKPRGSGPWALQPAGGRVLHVAGHVLWDNWDQPGWRQVLILNLLIESERRR